MPEKINWSLNAQIVGGPKVLSSDIMTVDAYDKVQVDIDTGDEKKVEVQPGDDGQVQFFMVVSNNYGEELTYRVNGETNDVKLDGPHLMIGKGAVSLLDHAPNSLTFKNGIADKSVSIEIIVGRDAIPS